MVSCYTFLIRTIYDWMKFEFHSFLIRFQDWISRFDFKIGFQDWIFIFNSLLDSKIWFHNILLLDNVHNQDHQRIMTIMFIIIQTYILKSRFSRGFIWYFLIFNFQVLFLSNAFTTEFKIIQTIKITKNHKSVDDSHPTYPIWIYWLLSFLNWSAVKQNMARTFMFEWNLNFIHSLFNVSIGFKIGFP